MKRMLLFTASLLVLGFGVLVVQPAAVLAVNLNQEVCTNPNAAEKPDFCDESTEFSASGAPNPLFGPNGIVTVAIRILSFVVGVAAVVVLIISGIKMMTANGNANSFNEARQSVIYALVAVVIAVSAQAIAGFVLSRL